MSDPSTQFSTIMLTRIYDVPIGRVFSAVTEPAERPSVYLGNEHLSLVFDEIDTRVGGRDTFRFGCGDHLRFRGESLYLDIVPDRRLVFTDIVSEGERRLWIATTTLELKPLAPQRTQLKVTAQLAWLDGAEAIDGCDGRYAGLLDNL